MFCVLRVAPFILPSPSQTPTRPYALVASAQVSPPPRHRPPASMALPLWLPNSPSSDYISLLSESSVAPQCQWGIQDSGSPASGLPVSSFSLLFPVTDFLPQHSASALLSSFQLLGSCSCRFSARKTFFQAPSFYVKFYSFFEGRIKCPLFAKILHYLSELTGPPPFPRFPVVSLSVPHCISSFSISPTGLYVPW